MMKLWKEIQYFLGQLRCDYPRQREEEKFFNVIQPLMSIELKPYTYIECLTVAATAGVPRTWQGRLAGLLFSRSNRGKDTMETVHNILNYKLGTRHGY